MILRRHATNFKRGLTNYFRLTALEDNVTFVVDISSNLSVASFIYLDYSINEGKTWIRIINRNSLRIVTNIANIRIGDSVLLRGKGTTLSRGIDTNRDLRIRANKKYSVSGLLMSLLYGKSATENTLLIETPVSAQRYAFKSLFLGSTTLVDASNLILPQNSCEYCYFCMFNGCTSLTKAPYLPALTIAHRAYEYLFNNCTSLTYLKVNADITGSNSYSWVKSPLPNLEYHRNPAATSWVTGANGIPLLCTVFNDTEELDTDEVTFTDPEVQRIALAVFGNRKPLYVADRWKGNVRIGGVNGKLLRRQIADVQAILTEFANNSTITDASDFTKFTGLIKLGIGQKTGFYNCTNLQVVNIPPTVTCLGQGYSYGKGCFGNCRSLQELYIPDSVTTMNSSCFYNCTSLTYVRYSSNCPFPAYSGSYNNEFFYNCSNLEEIENFPTSTTTLITANSFRGCNKLDFSSILDFKKLVRINNRGLNGGADWPSEIVFSSLTNISENYALCFREGASCTVDKIYLPKVNCTFNRYSIESLATLVDIGKWTGGLFCPYHYANAVNPNNGAYGTYILRTKTLPSFSAYNGNLKRLYVYPFIIDDFKTTYSTLASKTLPISGEQWVTDFGSSYEYADYPTSQAFSVDDSLDYYHEYTDYNSSLTMTTHFNGTSWRTIIFPTDRISGSNIEIAEITGVTITEVDDELDSFTLTTSLVTGDVITPGKPYLIRATDGESTKTLSANPAPVFESIALPSITILDADSKYQFVIKGTYEAKDDLVDSYVWDGSAWILDSEISPMRAYITVTKLKQE